MSAALSYAPAVARALERRYTRECWAVRSFVLYVGAVRAVRAARRGEITREAADAAVARWVEFTRAAGYPLAAAKRLRPGRTP